jgi:hypothetical protein
MKVSLRWILLAAAMLLLPAAAPLALRYEAIPEENTVICDDTDAIVITEYLRRVRESLGKDKPRTIAAELRRVAALTGRAADSSSGEARDVLKTIQSQALKLAYAAETNAESAARQIREFAARTENFLEGEWVLLEARQALTRGDVETARILLTVAAQQMERRTQRAPKERGAKFEDIARELRGFLEEQDALKSGEASRRIADFAKSVRDLAAAEPKAGKSSDKTLGFGTSEDSAAGASSFGTGRFSTSKSYDSSDFGSYGSKSSGSRAGKSETAGSGAKRKGTPGKKTTAKSGKSARSPYVSRSSDLESKDTSAESKDSSTETETLKSSDTETSPSDSLGMEATDSTSSDSLPNNTEP